MSEQSESFLCDFGVCFFPFVPAADEKSGVREIGDGVYTFALESVPGTDLFD